MTTRLLLPFFLLSLSASTALAQGRDPAGAEKLYDDGSKLLTAGDWPAACAKFEQSFSLDAAPGTLLNLASCAEHDGKIALAWSRLRDARSLNLDTKSDTRRKQIDSFVSAAISRLEPRLPYLTVKIKGGAAGTVVTRDGEPTALDVELPIDPGKHVIEASAPGFSSVQREIKSSEGAHETITLELLPAKEAAPTEPLERPKGPFAVPLPPRTPPPDPQPAGGMSGMRIAGIVIGAAGVATIGGSIATGVLALSKQSDLDELGCTTLPNENLGCPVETAAQASELSSSGATLALASTVTTFVGAGLVGAGVLLFIFGKNGEPEASAERAWLSPSAGPGGAGLLLSGSF
jgi:hypothetical protein